MEWSPTLANFLNLLVVFHTDHGAATTYRYDRAIEYVRLRCLGQNRCEAASTKAVGCRTSRLHNNNDTAVMLPGDKGAEKQLPDRVRSFCEGLEYRTGEQGARQKPNSQSRANQIRR
jgi:hypothetical protein